MKREFSQGIRNYTRTMTNEISRSLVASIRKPQVLKINCKGDVIEKLSRDINVLKRKINKH